MSIHFQKLHSIFPTEEKTFFSQTLKNSASSVTDLRVLLNAEKALLTLLSEYEEMSTIAREILEAEGFTVAAISNSDVLHPIDGYNLIKRLGRAWPKVQEAMKLLVDKDRQEMDNVKNVDKMDKVENLDKDKEGVDVSVSSMLVRQFQTALKQFPSWEENRVCF